MVKDFGAPFLDDTPGRQRLLDTSGFPEPNLRERCPVSGYVSGLGMVFCGGTSAHAGAHTWRRLDTLNCSVVGYVPRVGMVECIAVEHGA